MKAILLLIISLNAYTQTYYSDSVALYIANQEDWYFCRKVAKLSGIKFSKNEQITFYDSETDVKMRYSNMTDLGDALRFDFTDTGTWVVLIFQKDFSQYETYYRNKDCSAIRRVYSISKR